MGGPLERRNGTIGLAVGGGRCRGALGVWCLVGSWGFLVVLLLFVVAIRSIDGIGFIATQQPIVLVILGNLVTAAHKQLTKRLTGL